MKRKLALLSAILALLLVALLYSASGAAAKHRAFSYRVIQHARTYDVVKGHGRTLKVMHHAPYVRRHGARRYRVVARHSRFIVLRRISLAGSSVSYLPGNTPIVSGTTEPTGLPASASSSQPGYPSSSGNDGMTITRWAASSKRFPQWWMIDLGSPTAVTGVRTDWYQGSRRTYRYRVEASLDGVTFMTAADRSKNQAKGVTTDAMDIQARYVRLQVLGVSASGATASANEVTIYASATPSIADPTPVPNPTDTSPTTPTPPPSTPTPSPTLTALAPTYYVRNGGNDLADGRSDATAWATVSRVIAARPSPGAVIAFKCGDVWRESIYLHNTGFPSGTAGNQITFTSYGSGAKPKFLGGLDLSSPGLWEAAGANLWRCSTPTFVTVALHMDAETLHGRQRADTASLTQQGDFCWIAGYTYLYSVGHPGSYYSNIESANANASAPYTRFGFHAGTKSFLTVSGLDFRYWGSGGITSYPGRNHIYEHNDVSWIGPNTLSFQAGNGIGGQGTSNDIIRYNRVHQCIDAGLSPINYSTDGTLTNNSFYGNVVSNCEYGYEQQSYDTGDYNGIQVYGNVFYDMGDTIWHDVRRANDKWGCGLQSWNHANATASNCRFDNNIVYGSLLYHVRRPAVGWTCQGNRYSLGGGSKFSVYGVSDYDFAGWQASGSDSSGSIMSTISGSDDEILAKLTAMAGIDR